jgi:Rrf2 family cysteine metabolism transcriptional repressor
MKLVTKDTDYAVRALMTLAADGERFFSAREIAEIHGIPYPFLRRILRTLTNAALIVSKEGARGGAKLNADPAKIRIAELIGMFQGEIELTDCLVRGTICPDRSTCVLREEIKRIERTVRDELGQITIQTLMRGDSRNRIPHQSRDNAKRRGEQ